MLFSFNDRISLFLDQEKNVSAYVAGRYADLYQILLLKKSDATVIVIYQVRRTEKKMEKGGGREEKSEAFKFDKDAVLPFKWRTTGL